MTKRINHVAPLQLGIVLSILYGAISLILVPLLILGSLFGGISKQGLTHNFNYFFSGVIRHCGLRWRHYRSSGLQSHCQVDWWN